MDAAGQVTYCESIKQASLGQNLRTKLYAKRDFLDEVEVRCLGMRWSTQSRRMPSEVPILAIRTKKAPAAECCRRFVCEEIKADFQNGISSSMSSNPVLDLAAGALGAGAGALGGGAARRGASLRPCCSP